MPAPAAVPIDQLCRQRATDPGAVHLAAGRRRAPTLAEAAARRPLLIAAADHPARGALRVGSDPVAMGERADLLRRLATVLANDRVDGVLATADVIDDLLLMGALDGKVVIGSMNRGGLAGAAWELDDAFTGYDAAGLAARGLQGGKMLLRIDLDDRDTNPTLRACADAVGQLARQELTALVEPLPMRRDASGGLALSGDVADHVRAATVAAGLGWSSAYTWLKLPVVPGVEAALAATTLPVLLLGGDPGSDPQRVLDGWRRALRAPTVLGLVPGRALLYPPSGDVAAAVEQAVEVLESAAA